MFARNKMVIPNETAVHDYSLEGSLPAGKMPQDESQAVPETSGQVWSKIRSENNRTDSTWDRIRARKSVQAIYDNESDEYDADEWLVSDGTDFESKRGIGSNTISSSESIARHNKFGDIVE